jgi:hypothetical protein
VVGGALADSLDEDGKASGVLTVPGLEGLEELKTVRLGVDGDVDGSTVLGRSLVGVLTSVVAARRELLAGGVGELELLAVGALERVRNGVEGEGSTEDHGGNEVRGSDEGVGSRVGVVATGEVTVVGGNDRVGGALGDVLAVPLTDAGSASVGEDDTADLLERLHLAVTGDGGTDLLGTGGDGETGLSLEAVSGSLLSDRGGARHVLVGRVGAGTDETDGELVGPVVGLRGLGELGEGSGEVGGVGTVDVGLKLGEVDLDDLVVLGVRVGGEVVLEGLGVLADVVTLGSVEVVTHAGVVGEEGGGSTDLGTHVTDGGHSSAGERVDTLTEVLDDGARSTLDGKDTGDLEDDIYGQRNGLVKLERWEGDGGNGKEGKRERR